MVVQGVAGGLQAAAKSLNTVTRTASKALSVQDLNTPHCADSEVHAPCESVCVPLPGLFDSLPPLPF